MLKSSTSKTLATSMILVICLLAASTIAQDPPVNKTCVTKQNCLRQDGGDPVTSTCPNPT